jgi:predicted nucleotidyltransferase
MPMTNTKNIFSIISKFKAENSNRYGIKKIGIFGSAALKPTSRVGDVDIVVELEDPDIFCLIGIKQDLEELLKSHVDIVRYREIMNQYLKQRIEKNAVYV